MEQTGGQAGQAAYIRCATRLLAVVKGLYQACDLPITGTGDLENVPPLPSWAGNICEQLHRTIFKRLVDLKPGGEQVDWRNFGRLLGVWQRQFTFLDDAWEGTESVSPEEATAPPTEPPDSFKIVPQSDLLQAVHDSLKDSIFNSLSETPVHLNDFLSGLAEGHELFLDPQGQFTGDRGRTAIYFILLGRWMEIEEMRSVHPPKTILNLYEVLAPSLGDPRLERFDWFCDVCNEIGLFVKGRGRPRKY
ncbi:MAG TPA: hypothetical protein VH413_01395 [Verrucomicrobiae bacterium]|nr:hypothetical protein [Verrucomicrobiae bacterium]